MRMPSYPAGVPNPLTRHVHPYPTRFHGTNSVRPVFTLPFAYNPQIVNMPSGMHGLGADYDVSQGIFRPGGYGGGLFDGNLAGMGALEDLGTKALQASLTTTTKAPAPTYGAPAPITSVPTVSPEASAQAAMVSGGDNKWVAFVVGGGLAIGVLVYLKKRKKI